MKNPPNIIINQINKDPSAKPFLEVEHVNFQLEYPNGEKSKVFTHDIVKRRCTDAVIICAYEKEENNEFPKVWLRSCVRPVISARYDYPNTQCNIWELPAGLIEYNESCLVAAQRELKEEIGFDISLENFEQIGNPYYGAIGLSSERLYYVAVNVTGLTRGKPSEDGSWLEKYGECMLLNFEDLAGEFKDQQFADMKTDLGLYILAHYLNIKEVS